MRPTFAAVVGAVVSLIAMPAPAVADGPTVNLQFRGQAIVPTGTVYRGTTVGGLSSITYDAPRGVLYALSDDILRYNLQTGRLDRQWVYETDAVAQPPAPATQFSVNGLVELLPLNNEFLIAMERSFSVGAPGTGNTIKLYGVALPGATDVNGLDNLHGRVRPARKTLLLDLDELGIPLDNVEGMTFGPRLPDGRQSLVLVSDNNFAATQFTQFLLFALGR